MDLKEFAAKYELRIKKDSCDDQIIPGRLACKDLKDRPENHHHLYEADGNVLLYVNMPTKGRFNSMQRRIESHGAMLVTRGDFDGFFSLDGCNAEDTKSILKVLGFRVKRKMSPEAAAKLRERLQRSRKIKEE